MEEVAEIVAGWARAPMASDEAASRDRRKRPAMVFMIESILNTGIDIQNEATWRHQ